MTMKNKTTSDDQQIEEAVDNATDAILMQAEPLTGGSSTEDPIGVAGLMHVPVQVTVQLGSAKMNLSDLMQLGPGSILTLDREAHEPCDILVNGRVIARGEVVTVGELYGVRISEICSAS
jgi:flagellar motor switch protein FliN/FliY